MNQSSMGPGSSGLAPGELGVGAWIAFWGQFAALGFVAVLGAFFASENTAPGDDACGLALSLATIILGFMRLKCRFDDAAADWCAFLLVDDMPNLVAVIVIFTVLALAGLFVAAGFDHGGLHNGGVAFFVASGLAVFLNLKHVFDNLDRRA